eukprot:768744-Hanusia_phi.AAC.3
MSLRSRPSPTRVRRKRTNPGTHGEFHLGTDKDAATRMSQRREEQQQQHRRAQVPTSAYEEISSDDNFDEYLPSHRMSAALEISSSSSSSKSRERWEGGREDLEEDRTSNFLSLQQEFLSSKNNPDKLRESAEKWRREAERLLKIGEDMTSIILSKEQELEVAQMKMERSSLDEKNLKRQVKALKIKNQNLRNSIENLETQMKKLRDEYQNSEERAFYLERYIKQLKEESRKVLEKNESLHYKLKECKVQLFADREVCWRVTLISSSTFLRWTVAGTQAGGIYPTWRVIKNLRSERTNWEKPMPRVTCPEERYVERGDSTRGHRDACCQSEETNETSSSA